MEVLIKSFSKRRGRWGERRTEQEALFYEFSLERHVPGVSNVEGHLGRMSADPVARKVLACRLDPVGRPTATADYLVRHFGLRDGGLECATQRRLSTDGGALDVRDGGGFWPGSPRGGTIDHVALGVQDLAALEAVRATLAAEGPT